VLFRAAHHSDLLEIELGRRNIPFVKYGGLKFLEAAHVKDVLAILRWAENPRDGVAAFRALQLLPGIGPATARETAPGNPVMSVDSPSSGEQRCRSSRNGGPRWPSLPLKSRLVRRSRVDENLAVGRYTQLDGTAHFAVDPNHPGNRCITDLDLAPRDGNGRVRFAADLRILTPEDPRRSGHRLLLDVANRGNRLALAMFNRVPRPIVPGAPLDCGDGFLMRHGYTVVRLAA
jgi:hypothetical protein